MNHEILELFAQRIATEVRDPAIRICDRYNEGRMAGSLRNPIAEAKQLSDPDELVKFIIPFVVDGVIAKLLTAIEGGQIPLTFRDDSGNSVDLSVEYRGELSGWWDCDPEGWIGKYSKQRCIDLLAR